MNTQNSKFFNAGTSPKEATTFYASRTRYVFVEHVGHKTQNISLFCKMVVLKCVAHVQSFIMHFCPHSKNICIANVPVLYFCICV